MITNDSAKAQITALLRLINSATNDAIAEYEKTGAGIPAPGSKVAHPLDNDYNALSLKKAIRVLEGACHQLCATLAQPTHTLINRSMPYEASCIRLVLNLKLADILLEYPDGASLEALALKTGVNGQKLGHILRLLATLGCFAEVTPNVFSNNRISLSLLSTNPVSDFIGLLTNECAMATNSLPEVMMDPDYTHSSNIKSTAFTLATKNNTSDPGAGKPYFEWLKEHPTVEQRFHRAMTGGSIAAGSMSVVNVTPWGELPAGATFCDVGSGVGGISMLLAKEYDLKLTLQDLEGPLEKARKYWSDSLPSAVEAQTVNFVPLNFLNESPIKNQDVYYIKSVLLDWPDADAITILRNIAKVMKPTSRLFIHEYILQHLDPNSSSKPSEMAIAPEPLLPNYGAGGVMGYRQDMIMLALFNSIERTYDEFVRIGTEAGLSTEKVWDLGETSLLELKLA